MLKITVITVCYNAEDKIRETVESVLNQTYSNYEYLIIDGESNDGTTAILKDYSERKNIFIYSEKDYGIYNAMNRGIARSSGDYIFFLNVGDKFYNEHVLENMCSCMEKNMEIIYYGKVCLMYPDGSEVIEDFSEWDGSLEGKALDGFMPCHQSIFAPRKLLTDHYFREKYKIRADYEWFVYSISKGSKCKNVPVVVSYYDTSGVSGKYRNRSLSLQEEKLIVQDYEKCFEQKIGLSEQKKETIKWKYLAQKHLFMLQLMDQWMELKQRMYHVDTYLWERNYRHIAIYGMGYIGRRLYNDLTGKVTINYVIDQNINNKSIDVRVYSPDDKLETVDAVIVTPIMCFDEIRGKLSQKMSCPIIAFEDIIHEMIVGLEHRT